MIELSLDLKPGLETLTEEGESGRDSTRFAVINDVAFALHTTSMTSRLKLVHLHHENSTRRVGPQRLLQGVSRGQSPFTCESAERVYFEHLPLRPY